MHVAICIPAYGDWKPGFCTDLIDLIGYQSEGPERVPNVSTQIFTCSGSILPQVRQDIVLNALRSEPDYLLWLDSDMRFPPDALSRLLKRELPIVGTNYTSRKYPHRPVANVGGERYSSLGKTGVEVVNHTGFGCLLTKASIFSEIDKPWFMFAYLRNDSSYVGEDTYFFHRCASAGYRCHIDHDLSQEIRHIGDAEYDVHSSGVN